MPSQTHTWTRFLARVGIRREMPRSRRPRNDLRRLRFERFEDRRMLAILVNSFEDDGDDGNTTLREAIQAAEDNPGFDTIEFHPNLDGAIITLEHGQFNIGEAARLHIDASMLNNGITINGKCHGGRILQDRPYNRRPHPAWGAAAGNIKQSRLTGGTWYAKIIPLRGAPYFKGG